MLFLQKGEGVLVTMCCCISAIGHNLPPAYVFPRVHFKHHMIAGSPPGSVGFCASPSIDYSSSTDELTSPSLPESEEEFSEDEGQIDLDLSNMKGKFVIIELAQKKNLKFTMLQKL
ncbi:hypothetical protein SNE40_008083 [Patella caerulea]|uniref:Uncharacterized protein n=1 Tax=Patella caerulea TaxID=87958 RepID=A0AAN8JY47_PATCE